MEMKSLIDDGLEMSSSEAMQEPAVDGEQTALALLRLAGFGAWSILRGSRVLRWDDCMHSLFGLDSGTFSGKKEDFFDLVHPQDRDRVRRQFLDAFYEGAQFVSEYRVVWPCDGSAHVLRSKGQMFQGETSGAGRMAGICWDVTEAREKEQELALERHRMRFFVENVPDKIYFKDVSGRFLRINQAMRDWFGEEEDEGVIGKTDFGFFTEEHARQAFEDEYNVISTGAPIVHKEERETCRDGRTTWVSTTKMPLRDPDGRIVGICGISIDITRQKRIEARLLERLEELRIRNAELEEALRRKS